MSSERDDDFFKWILLFHITDSERYKNFTYKQWSSQG